MSDIWYLKSERKGGWYKLKYRNDLSGLSDVFEYMEDDYENGIKKGMSLTMDYGCMGDYIKNEELLRNPKKIYYNMFRYVLKKSFVSFCVILSGLMFGLQSLFHFHDIEIWVKVVFGIASIVTIGVGIHIWMNRWEGLRQDKTKQR